jgi:hypothetical protein
MGPTKKMPRRGDIQVRPHTAVDPALLGIRRTISSSRSGRSEPVELQRVGGRLVRQTRNASGT